MPVIRHVVEARLFEPEGLAARAGGEGADGRSGHCAPGAPRCRYPGADTEHPEGPHMNQLPVDDPVALTLALVDLPSVSGDEARAASAVEAALRAAGYGEDSRLEILRDGDAVCARTRLGLATRIAVAGHLDTVPIADNVPGRREQRDGRDTVWGRGSVDMKGGVAAALASACRIGGMVRAGEPPTADATWIFYDHEEVASHLNGLGRVQRNHPRWLEADLAVLGEPTGAHIEGGCNGTLRVIARFEGEASHSARAWRGDNAIHKTAPVIARVAAFGNPVVAVDGLDFRESLSVVRISGGIADNVVPDAASMTVNYRFAPSKSAEQALGFVRGLFEGSGARLEVDDLCDGARPGADSPAASRLIDAARAVAARDGGEVRVRAKVGWTDVARFSAAGVPALNFGPGDPLLAHTRDEHVAADEVVRCSDTLMAMLTGKGL